MRWTKVSFNDNEPHPANSLRRPRLLCYWAELADVPVGEWLYD